ncbi:MAG: 3,4-dihydroxy-2-butanone-4-phosphate synthase, partial [Candidatus Acidiferrales bacterium]
MATKSALFATVEEAIEEIRQGRMIIIVDDEDRENEGDLTVAAEKINPEQINFMAKHGRGLVCVSLTSERCDHFVGIYREPILASRWPAVNKLTQTTRCARD